MLKLEGWGEAEFRGTSWATRVQAPGTAVAVDLREFCPVTGGEQITRLAGRKVTVIVLLDEEPMLDEAKALLALCRRLE